jgi:hypothetical protein
MNDHDKLKRLIGVMGLERAAGNTDHVLELAVEIAELRLKLLIEAQAAVIRPAHALQSATWTEQPSQDVS